MCDYDADVSYVPKYKPDLCLYDKIVMGLVLTTMVICVGFLIYGVFNPIYLMC